MNELPERTPHTDPQLTCINPSEGPKAIAMAYDVAIASFYVLDLIKKNEKQYDGFIIACGADPGIGAAREIVRKPIVGIGESSYMWAAQVASKFSVICPCVPGGEAVAWEGVRALGLERKCASVKLTGDKDVLGCFSLGPKEMVETLYQLGREAVEKDGARALVLLCAGMTGTREVLEKRLKVPVLDGVVTALKTLEQFPPRG